MTNRVKNFLRQRRNTVYRYVQDLRSEYICVGYVHCPICDEAVPVYTQGLDAVYDEEGNEILVIPPDFSDLEMHRMSHDVDTLEAYRLE